MPENREGLQESDMHPADVPSENARCPECGSARVDRIDRIEHETRRRIERVEDTGSVYGLRPVSGQPDRGRQRDYRGGVGLECAECGWGWRGDCGDAERAPEYQAVLRLLLGDR